MQAMTSDDEREIKNCLSTLKHTHAGTGFMHETFLKDNPNNFTRSWFAWANTLFGELILKIAAEHPNVCCQLYKLMFKKLQNEEKIFISVFQYNL